jgi:adenylate cyclase
MDYTAIGDTVNVASRLTSQAGPGQIVISNATHAQLGREISCCPLSAMKLKGRAEPIDVHEVLWRDSSPQNRTSQDFKPLGPA